MIYYTDDYKNDLARFLNINCIYDLVSKKKIEYVNIACSFDIETSSFYEKNEKRSVMYIWQFAINDDVLIGRTWGDFISLLRALQCFLFLDDKRRIVIYIHNLSYEFQFFRKQIPISEVFATDDRKPLYCICPWGFEFRCSYRLSGYSLSTVANNLQRFKIRKLVGDLDYSLVRHSKTEIKKEELGYCVNDVLIVTAYIREQIDEWGDISRIPLTQTGKVRRFVRDECFKVDGYKRFISRLRLDAREYVMLRQTFQGGFTHANAMYARQLMKDVTSYDFTSSYPTVMLAEKFPMSKGKFIGDVNMNEYLKYSQDYCCLFALDLNNIKSKFTFERIISLSKCYKISDNRIVDNGRIFSADSISILCTETDFDNICRFYDFSDCRIYNLYIYKKDYLPKSIIDSILKFYNDKTQLKGVVGKEVEYLHSKEMLNSCYGMIVTDLLNDTYTYEHNEWGCVKKNVMEAIDEYNNNRNRFLFYPWGVWVTSYARRNLFSGILECKNDYIYSDTDSIKIMNAENHLNYINRYNEIITRKIKDMCSHYGIDKNLVVPGTKDGKKKPIGVWDYDGHYKYFKTLGAKRYLVAYDDDTISMTVAGVNKKTAKEYIRKETLEKTFDFFDDNLFIPSGFSGKKTLTYIDDEISGIMKDYRGCYNEYNEKSCIHMENADYSLNISSIYADFLLRLNKKIY